MKAVFHGVQSRKSPIVDPVMEMQGGNGGRLLVPAAMIGAYRSATPWDQRGKA